ncbi:MAG: hypothetical protein IKH46_00980 [Lachnospiraceae bacterium]|nr:hypothetical protein [Lachnospiraceae bacterium]
MAGKLIREGDYESAYTILCELSNTDAVFEMKLACINAMIVSEEYVKAFQCLEKLEEHTEVVIRKNHCINALVDAGRYDEADALCKQNRYKYNYAVRLLEVEEYEMAYPILMQTGNGDMVNKNVYERASLLLDSGDYEAAIEVLKYGYNPACEVLLDRCYCERMGEEMYAYFKDLSAGDIYTFGRYEQDGDPLNGEEDIEWIVLKKNGWSVDLVSRYVLDSRAYDRLEEWLNDMFYQQAFTEEEKNLILDFQKGSDDKIGLLSREDLRQYGDEEEEYICAMTEYALKQGSYTVGSRFATIGDDKVPMVCWWLCDGTVAGADGEECDAMYCLGVRPAIHVDLSLYERGK